MLQVEPNGDGISLPPALAASGAKTHQSLFPDLPHALDSANNEEGTESRTSSYNSASECDNGDTLSSGQATSDTSSERQVKATDARRNSHLRGRQTPHQQITSSSCL